MESVMQKLQAATLVSSYIDVFPRCERRSSTLSVDLE